MKGLPKSCWLFDFYVNVLNCGTALCFPDYKIMVVVNPQPIRHIGDERTYTTFFLNCFTKLHENGEDLARCIVGRDDHHMSIVK
jgi:hypothetical protein